MNIKKSIDKETVKKIFSSSDNAKKYLIELEKIKGDIGLNYKIFSRGKNKGQKVIDMNPNELFEKIISTWDYNLALKIIRNLFRLSEKYQRSKNAKDKIKSLIKEWKDLNLGEIKWPCSQGAFDEFVQRVNNSSEENKDKLVAGASVRYRRMKELNTLRNDFLEILIFEKNKNILPTLKHSKGTDYFIDGESFDQKVAKSPTDEFKKTFKDKWKQEAIEHPEKVAEFLYEYQDEGRFGADSRLLVVYLDDNISPEKIEETINHTDLNNPLEIEFTYKHDKFGERDYKVKCFIIILSND